MSDAPPQDASGGAPRRRLRRTAIALACLLLALVIGLRLVAADALRSLVEREGGAALGRTVQIEAVGLSLLAGRLDARGIEIGGATATDARPDPPAVLRLDGLSATLDWAALLRREIHLRELAFESPRVALERLVDGSLVPLVVADPASQDPEPSDAAAWPLVIDRLVLRDGETSVGRIGASEREFTFAWESLGFEALTLREGVVEISDVSLDAPSLRVDRRAASKPGTSAAAAEPPPDADPAPEEAPDTDVLDRHTIASLSVKGARLTLLEEVGDPLVVTLDVSARGVSAARGATFPLSLAAEHDGAGLSIEGKLGLRPVLFEGVVDWESLRLARLAEVFAGEELEITSGTTQGRLDVTLAPAARDAASPTLRLGGALALRDVALATADVDAAWEGLDVELAETVVPLDGEVGSISLSRVVLQAPKLDYTLRPAARDTAEDVEAPERASPRVAIERLELAAGELRFRDETLSRPFETAWSAVELSANDLRWPQGDARGLTLAARGPSGSMLTIAGNLREGNGRIDARLRNLALASLDPYAATHTGMRIGAGRGTIDGLVLELEPGTARVDSAIVLRDLRVEESEAGWFERIFGMRLDLALALLRDLRGDIRLPLDADFERGAARIDTVGLIASALRQAVVGALTSPLKILGSAAALAGEVGGRGVPILESSPGRAEPTEGATDRLPGIADMLAARPGLQLAVRGQAGPADDPVLARDILIEHAQRGDPLPGEEALGAPERRRAREALASLETATAAIPDPETEALLDRLAAEVAVPEARRLALAAARGARVRDELVTHYGLAPEEVIALEPREGKPGVALELQPGPEAS